MREKGCAKRTKGIEASVRARMSNKALSSQTRRCHGPGGASGKSNNGGAAPRYERNGVYTSPGPRRPHSVEATVIR